MDRWSRAAHLLVLLVLVVLAYVLGGVLAMLLVRANVG